MLSDPQFWVAVAFVIFIFAIFKPVKKMITSSLDAKISEIKNQIEEAENLKNETKTTLSDIKKRQNEVKIEIENIHNNAKDKIINLETQAHKKLDEQINKKEILINSKIDQIIRDTNLSIHENITYTAIQSTLLILEENLNNDDKQQMINQSIQELEIAVKN